MEKEKAKEIKGEQSLKLKNLSVREFMQHVYRTKLRKDFVKMFGHYYCEHSGMNSYIGSVLKSNCNHRNYPNIMKNQEFAIYVANILNEIDSKLRYIDDQRKRVKTSYSHFGKDSFKICLSYTPNSISIKQNCIESIGNISSTHILKSNVTFKNTDALENCSNNTTHKSSINTSFHNSHEKKQADIISVNNLKEHNTAVETLDDLTICISDIENNILQETENKVNPVQINSVTIQNNLSSETYNTIDETSSTHLQNSFTKKRSKSGVDLQHISKKKKLEQLSDSDSIQSTSNSVMDDSKNIVSPASDLMSNQLIASEHKKPLKQNVFEKINSDFANNSNNKVTKNCIQNCKGETQLHILCAKGKLESLTSLLLDGLSPNVKDNAGWTPLHEAVKFGHLNIVKILIDFGAFLNVPGFEYESPLFTAVKYDKFDIAKLLLQKGADSKCINIYGNNAQSVNEKMWSKLSQFEIPCVSEIKTFFDELDEIVIFLNNVSLNSAIVNQFCKQFKVKLIKKVSFKNQLKNITHIVVPVVENNACDANFECLMGIANGICIINQNWIVDSLESDLLQPSLSYEVSGTTYFVDCNGPKMSRLNKQKLLPKLFDGINVHINGRTVWKTFSVEHLKEIALELGAKILKRVPNPEDCASNIIPYHCQNSEQMRHVSTIILYCEDSKRLIKYNMNHLKTFPVLWFLEAVQKFSII